MSINSELISALTPIIPVVKPDAYRPLPNETPATEYIVFNYTELPTLHADNEPHAMRYLVQVHYFCPWNVNPSSKKKRIRQALHGAGFTYPSTTNASDDDGQHFVFEAEYLDGDV